MQVLVLNAVRARGISQKTGNEYDICTITYGNAVQPVQKDNRQVIGYGYQVQELALNPAALAGFKDVKFPAMLNLDVQPDPRNINRNICVGLIA